MKVIYLLFIPLIIFSQNPDISDSLKNNSDSQENKFSFGVVYIPYFSGTYYHYIYDPYYGYRTTYIIGSFESTMESQFSYALNPDLRIIFDFGYSSSFIERRYERHDNYDNYGSEETDDMKIFFLNIGAKYYFTEFLNKTVSAYIQASIGKQIAIVENKYKNLYPDPYYQQSFSDNENEFLEDINSPVLVNIGFGTEYFFNNSLSLNANFRFVYSSYSAEYKSKEDYQSGYNYQNEKIENSEIIHRVGLGLNFYF